MSDEGAIARHYGSGDLRARIFAAMAASGLDPDKLKPADLGPVDEFHMGGRAATADIVKQLGLQRGDRVLDIGCGLGGLVRYLADEAGCRATGLDLTPEFIEIAQAFSVLTGLEGMTDFVVGSALALPFPNGAFDAAVTFHAAMNIADRETMYREAARVIRPGGKLAIYDVFKGETEGMRFPVPWAETAADSHLRKMGAVAELLVAVGFADVTVEDRTRLILAHHRKRLAEGAQKSPPVLGVHLLQGENAKAKSRNMIAMAQAGQIALGLIVARRAAEG